MLIWRLTLIFSLHYLTRRNMTLQSVKSLNVSKTKLKKTKTALSLPLCPFVLPSRLRQTFPKLPCFISLSCLISKGKVRDSPFCEFQDASLLIAPWLRAPSSRISFTFFSLVRLSWSLQLQQDKLLLCQHALWLSPLQLFFLQHLPPPHSAF